MGKFSQWANNAPGNVPFQVGKIINTNQGLASIVEIVHPTFKSTSAFTPGAGVVIIAKLMSTGELFEMPLSTFVFPGHEDAGEYPGGGPSEVY